MTEHDPNLVIELRVAGSNEVLKAYDDGVLDAALVLQSEDSRRSGEVLFAESFAWIAAAHWQPRSGQPLPLSTQGETCSIRTAAVRALDSAGIAWTEVFIGKGAAVVGAAATIGLAVAVLPKRAAPSGTIDICHALSLPPLPTHEVVLYSALHDSRLQCTSHARDGIQKSVQNCVVARPTPGTRENGGSARFCIKPLAAGSTRNAVYRQEDLSRFCFGNDDATLSHSRNRIAQPQPPPEVRWFRAIPWRGPLARA
jgi:DNA-binding transcriptional LysR family regulator